MKHPKSCNGCRAFYQSQYIYDCDLGYKLTITRKRKYKGRDIVSIKPRYGECPKPLTIDELINAKKAY